MGQLVEFDLDGGGRVLVDVRGSGAGQPVTRGLNTGQVVEKGRQSFEQAVSGLRPAAEVIISRLREMADSPDEVSVEFGLDLHAEAGAFIAAASVAANFKVSVTWRRA